MKYRIHDNKHFIITDGESYFEYVEPEIGLITVYPDHLERVEGNTAEQVLNKVLTQLPSKDPVTNDFIEPFKNNLKGKSDILNVKENWVHSKNDMENWIAFKKANPKSNWHQWNN
jgi:hypothetical protein